MMNPNNARESIQEVAQQAGAASTHRGVPSATPSGPLDFSAPPTSPAADATASPTAAKAAAAVYYDSDGDDNKPGGPDPWDVDGGYGTLIKSQSDCGELYLCIDDTTPPRRLWGSFVQGSLNGVLRALDIAGIEDGRASTSHGAPST